MIVMSEDDQRIDIQYEDKKLYKHPIAMYTLVIFIYIVLVLWAHTFMSAAAEFIPKPRWFHWFILALIMTTILFWIIRRTGIGYHMLMAK